MKYSKRFKESVLRKVLPLENRSVAEDAREMGISKQTIHNWEKMLENGEQLLDEESSPSSIGRLEKFNLLLEGNTITEEDKVSPFVNTQFLNLLVDTHFYAACF